MPTVELKTNREASFGFTFTIEDGVDTGTITGNGGAAKVSVLWGWDKITVIEVTPDMTAQTTTIYGKGRGTFGSVHPRGTGHPGFEQPSQNYGTCELR